MPNTEIMNFELDPKEVLMHLHDLGYSNISPHMLEAFIEDLKKLIKYDISKKKLVRRTECAEDDSSTLPNTTDESPPPSSPPPPSPILQRKQRIHYRSGPSSSKDAEEAFSSSAESSLPPTRRVLRECTKVYSQGSQNKDDLMNKKLGESSKVTAKPSKSCDCMWRQIGCKSCEENWSKQQCQNKTTKSKENLAPPRPKSSFIRTWQMTGQPRPGCASQRSDPVTLYHQYQQVWKQQKVPGENNHNDLRWTIRERMLGQEPQPRSCSCDCKCCPCKLNEADFSKTPKSVYGKHLSKGPFHVSGYIQGPLGLNSDGKPLMIDRRVQGMFQLETESESNTTETGGSGCTAEDKMKQQERAAWIPGQELNKSKEKCNDSPKKHQTSHLNITESELENVRANHDKLTCKYCGLIHYMFHTSTSHTKSSNNASLNSSYWPQQFTVEAEVHRSNDTVNTPNSTSKSRENGPSANSTMRSVKSRRGDGRDLNLAVIMEEQPTHSKVLGTNYFEAKVPIRLKDFKGEVKTEIEVFKRVTSRGQPFQDTNNSSKPLVVLATEVKINAL